MLEGPTAIAFLESDGDPVAVAKAIAAAARQTQVLVVRGGIMEGRTLTEDDVQNLAKLPAAEVLRAQLVGALAAPMSTVVGLFNAPLRDLVGVLQARIEQLEAEGPAAPTPEAAAAETKTETEPQPEPAPAQAEEEGES
jgi:large subunit ribosomal protein L10